MVAHIVVEEEIGGNGALSVTGRPLKGQAAIVMEPTGEAVQPVHRAGLWLKNGLQRRVCAYGGNA